MDAVLARYLPDFSELPLPPAAVEGPDFESDWFRPAAVRPAPIGVQAGGQANPGAEPVPPAPLVSEIVAFAPRTAPLGPSRPAEDREALIAAAEARGREQGRAEALIEAQDEALARREQERLAFEARLAQARRDWTETEAEALAEGFAASLRALDAELSERIARLLAPVLTNALRARALDELAAALRRLTAEPHHAAIRVSGPADLIAALAERLGGLSAGIAFAAAETPEVTVAADETVIETQLSAWSRLIAAAVAEA